MKTSWPAVVNTHRPRLVVLDVGLPDIDGLEVCRRLRQTSAVPVIFLTARDTEIDRVLGLELGADDYVTKPFSPPELVARVKAVLRRADGATPTAELVQVGRVTIDAGRREGPHRRDTRRVHGQGVRPPEVPRRASRPRTRANRSSTACGATTGTATPAPSTCTSPRCARRSPTRCASTPSAASDTGSTRNDRALGRRMRPSRMSLRTPPGRRPHGHRARRRARALGRRHLQRSCAARCRQHSLQEMRALVRRPRRDREVEGLRHPPRAAPASGCAPTTCRPFSSRQWDARQ